MQDRDLVYSCTIYEIARSGYAVSQRHLMSVLWVGCVGMLPRSFRSPSVKQSLQDRTDIWRNVTI